MDIRILNNILAKGVKNILFVCTGNICRSPIAEFLLRKELKKINNSDIAIKSAGLLELRARQADPQMIALCEKHNVDLTPHRSQQITLQMINDSDIVFVMETGHRDALIKLKPEDEDKILLLGIFDFTHNGLNISDPLGNNHQKYEYCFSRIHTLIRKLSQMIQETSPMI